MLRLSTIVQCLGYRINWLLLIAVKPCLRWSYRWIVYVGLLLFVALKWLRNFLWHESPRVLKLIVISNLLLIRHGVSWHCDIKRVNLCCSIVFLPLTPVKGCTCNKRATAPAHHHKPSNLVIAYPLKPSYEFIFGSICMTLNFWELWAPRFLAYEALIVYAHS